MDTLDICLTQLNNVFNAIFLVYIPAIEVAMHESTTIIATFATFTNLGHEFYNILALAAGAHIREGLGGWVRNPP